MATRFIIEFPASSSEPPAIIHSDQSECGAHELSTTPLPRWRSSFAPSLETRRPSVVHAHLKDHLLPLLHDSAPHFNRWALAVHPESQGHLIPTSLKRFLGC